MNELSELIRVATTVNGEVLSNRKIAGIAGVSPGTVDRIMRGEGTPDVATVDKLADAFNIPRSRLRAAANLPHGESAPYEPPKESRLLNVYQRTTVDRVIRAMTLAYAEPYVTVDRLLDYLTPEELNEVAVKARALADDLEAGAEQAYQEPVDALAFMEALGLDPDGDEWWMDDVDTLARTYNKLLYSWGFDVESDFRSIMTNMEGPSQRPTPTSHYDELYRRVHDHRFAISNAFMPADSALDTERSNELRSTADPVRQAFQKYVNPARVQTDSKPTDHSSRGSQADYALVGDRAPGTPTQYEQMVDEQNRQQEAPDPPAPEDDDVDEPPGDPV